MNCRWPSRGSELRSRSAWSAKVPTRRLECGRRPSGWRTTLGVDAVATSQLIQYLAAGRAALGTLPKLDTIVFERFFDESGGMQLVIHSPYGSRVNRAWGLALRKRFCRTFNFELQAAATEDHIILSLTHAHSFELAEVSRYLNSKTARHVLIQALCAAPMFAVRWRWDAGIALALPRFRGGKKIPPQIARMNAEDLLASVFPDQVACAENLPGEIEIPDNPLVRQAIRDCLEDAMNVEGFEALLRGLESGAVRVVARDLTEPSPLALEALTARPYAYLDDAPLGGAAYPGRHEPSMDRSRFRLGPGPPGWRGHCAGPGGGVAGCGDGGRAARCLAVARRSSPTREVGANSAWPSLLNELAAQGRVARIPAPDARELWVATERRSWFEPRIPSSDEAMTEIVRGRLEGSGPVTARALAAAAGVPLPGIQAALAALEREGFALRGRFTPGIDEEEWCERRLLARIHRYTVKRLRAEIEPVSARDFTRFLFEWQRVLPDARMQGSDALAAVLSQLEGFEAPASAWETDILPSRIAEYEPEWLDEHCRAGRFVWTRLAARTPEPERGAAPVRSTPITLHRAAGPQILVGARRVTGSRAAHFACPGGDGIHSGPRRVVLR